MLLLLCLSAISACGGGGGGSGAAGVAPAASLSSATVLPQAADPPASAASQNVAVEDPSTAQSSAAIDERVNAAARSTDTDPLAPAAASAPDGSTKQTSATSPGDTVVAGTDEPSQEAMASATGVTGASLPASSEILAVLDASLPLSSQTWNGINCYGRVGSFTNSASTGSIEGSPLSDGSTLRFGQTADPLTSGRRAYVFRVGMQDTLFPDSRRCEAVAFPNAATALPRNQDFWYSVTLLVDKGGLTNGDDQLITQWHAQDYNPFMGLYLSGGRLRVTLRYNAATADSGSKPYAITPWVDSAPVERRWTTFVFNGRISPFAADNPYLKVWRDGVLLVNYKGPLGYNTPNLPYAKVGFYSWNNLNPWDSSAPIRSVYVRRAAILRNPTSSLSEPVVRNWNAR